MPSKPDIPVSPKEELPSRLESIQWKGLDIRIADTHETMSRLASDLIFQQIKTDPRTLLCAATGNTPTRTYDLLAEHYGIDPGAFSRLRVIKLDEWGGIPLDDPATCETYLRTHVVEPLHLSSDRYLSFASNPQDPAQEARHISELLAQAGMIDLCVLGLGLNGHLGFNEPADQLIAEAHRAELTETTRRHSMAQEAKHEIQYGLTLGMGDLLRSKKILLMVNGVHKQEQLRTFLSGRITPAFPASFLWLHPNTTLVCDREVFPDTTLFRP